MRWLLWDFVSDVILSTPDYLEAGGRTKVETGLALVDASPPRFFYDLLMIIGAWFI